MTSSHPALTHSWVLSAPVEEILPLLWPTCKCQYPCCLSVYVLLVQVLQHADFHAGRRRGFFPAFRNDCLSKNQNFTKSPRNHSHRSGWYSSRIRNKFYGKHMPEAQSYSVAKKQGRLCMFLSHQFFFFSPSFSATKRAGFGYWKLTLSLEWLGQSNSLKLVLMSSYIRQQWQ